MKWAKFQEKNLEQEVLLGVQMEMES